MRTLVTDENDIKKYQGILEGLLTSNLPTVGNRYSNGTIWYGTKGSNGERFWNFFGWSESDGVKWVENNIHITIPERLSGSFVENADGDIELIHRGLLNGYGYKFRDDYPSNRGNNQPHVDTLSNGEKVIVIGVFYSPNNKISPKDFIDKDLPTFIQDIRDFKDKNPLPPQQPKSITNKTGSVMPVMPSLNTILYGPPGTGKTFNTINEALKIIDSEFFDANKDNRKELKKRFDELVNNQQIRFVTFHQSYSYEEFVEGIRAETTDGQISYSVEDGIFKQLCLDAREQTIQQFDEIKENPQVWKISIEATYNNATKTYCYEHGEARIGWSNTGDLNLNPNLDDPSFKLGRNEKSCLNDFKNIKDGDIILCINSNSSISGVGVVIGNYEYDLTPPKEVNGYAHVRKVKWLLKDINFSILPFNKGKNFAIKTVDRLARVDWSILAMGLREAGYLASNIEEEKPCVLIIDEINRGNISKIFGELITLIETSKRLGEDEALTVTLPYSKQPFSVPDNVFIIGTMNTADRSLALMDTALRRRFEFIEMMPDYDVLKDSNGDLKVEGINIREMLETMNKRIEVLYDREHTLGHAFFMSLTSSSTVDDLAKIFKNKIIPLLQEYFFEDWEKIRIVLGDDTKNENYQFVRENKNNLDCFSKDIKEKYRLDKLKSYYLNEDALIIQDSYIGIYQNAK